MNAPIDFSTRFEEKFAVGQPVSRKEDPVLLRGEGRYSDDLNRDGQLYGMMVRSRVAHGTLCAIDADAAREMPGVRAVMVEIALPGGALLARVTPDAISRLGLVLGRPVLSLIKSTSIEVIGGWP